MSAPKWAEIISAAIDARLIDVHVSMPAVVKSYDEATCTITAQPVVRRALPASDGGIAHEDIPPIQNVPVVYPQGGTFSITWPLEPGDHVQLLFNSWANQAWRENGTLSDPKDLRLHSLSNPVALAGVNPDSSPPATATGKMLVRVESGKEMVVGGDGAEEQVVLAGKMLAELGNVAAAITGVGGTYNPPVNPDDIGALKLKAE